MTTAECLFACIRYTVFGVRLTQAEKETLTNEPLEDLYELSVRHDLAHLICEALKQNGMLPDDEWGRVFQKQKDLAIFRYIQQNEAYTEICRVLEEAEVPYVPLKGAIIRNFYPEPWMRTSCDIDILVHEEDLKKSIDCLETRGWKKESDGYHDISLLSPSGVNLELHFTLKETSDALDKGLEQVWDHVVPVESSTQCRMNEEFFMYHYFAHMSYHFVTGGCGIRPFVDSYLLQCKMEWDQSMLDSLLERGGIRQFGKMVLRLSKAWFTSEHQISEPTEKQILNYVLCGGVYGSKENHIRSQQARRGSKGKNVVNRIWLPYETLKNYYRSLEGKKYLLPFYEVRRWIRIVFKEKKSIKSIRELQSNLLVSDQEREEMKEIFDYLGLTEQYHDA